MVAPHLASGPVVWHRNPYKLFDHGLWAHGTRLRGARETPTNNAFDVHSIGNPPGSSMAASSEETKATQNTRLETHTDPVWTMLSIVVIDLMQRHDPRRFDSENDAENCWTYSVICICVVPTPVVVVQITSISRQHNIYIIYIYIRYQGSTCICI